MEFFFTALGCLIWAIIAAIIMGILFLVFAIYVYIRDQRKSNRDNFEDKLGKSMSKLEKH